jgi:hypothetical protein
MTENPFQKIPNRMVVKICGYHAYFEPSPRLLDSPDWGPFAPQRILKLSGVLPGFGKQLFAGNHI